MIAPEIFDLLQTGVSVIVGTRDEAFMPECTRAWGIRVADSGSRVTIFLTETVSRQTLVNLRSNGLIAISCTRPTDHVTCQLKGRVRSIRPANQHDQDTSARWQKDFAGELLAVGVPPRLCEAWITQPALAIDIDVTDVFVQTPGPGAGEKA